MKKLYKSQTDVKICGVCAGIAEYLGIDSTIIRLLWIFFAFTGAGVLFYIVCAFIMSTPPSDYNDKQYQ